MIEAQPDVEQPAEVAPGRRNILEDDAIEPKTLDRSFMRPDLKGGSEDAPPPQSAEENKQDKLDPPAEPRCRCRRRSNGQDRSANSTSNSARPQGCRAAAPIAQAIENLWLTTGSPTVDLLMSRAVRFTKESDLDLALKSSMHDRPRAGGGRSLVFAGEGALSAKAI